MSSSLPRYRRMPRSVGRTLRGTAWVGAPGRDTVVLQGSAVPVWIALDAPTSLPQLTALIHATWPELADVSEAQVLTVIDTLVEAGLAEPAVPADVPGER